MEQFSIHFFQKVLTEPLYLWSVIFIFIPYTGLATYFQWTTKVDIIDTSQTEILRFVTIIFLTIWIILIWIFNFSMIRHGVNYRWETFEWIIFSIYLLPFIWLLGIYVFLPQMYKHLYKLIPDKHFKIDTLEEDVRKISRKLGIIPPKICYSKSNKFAVYGNFYGNVTLVLPKNFGEFKEKELILSHELSHIKNKDAVFVSLSELLLKSAFFWIPILLLQYVICLLFYNQIDRTLTLTTTLFLPFVLSYFIFRVIYKWVSRFREFLADARVSTIMSTTNIDQINAVDGGITGFEKLLIELRNKEKLNPISSKGTIRYFRIIWKDLLNFLKQSVPIVHEYLFSTHPSSIQRANAFTQNKFVGEVESVPSRDVSVLIGMLFAMVINILFLWFPVIQSVIPLIETKSDSRKLITDLFYLLGFCFSLIIGLIFAIPMRNSINSPSNFKRYFLLLILRYFQAGFSTTVILFFEIVGFTFIKFIEWKYHSNGHLIELTLFFKSIDKILILLPLIYILAFLYTLILPLIFSSAGLRIAKEFEKVSSIYCAYISGAIFLFIFPFVITKLYPTTPLIFIPFSIWSGALIALAFSYLIYFRSFENIIVFRILGEPIFRFNISKFNTFYGKSISYLIEICCWIFFLFFMIALPSIILSFPFSYFFSVSSRISILSYGDKLIISTFIFLLLTIIFNKFRKQKQANINIILLYHNFIVHNLIEIPFQNLNNVQSLLNKIMKRYTTNKERHFIIADMDTTYIAIQIQRLIGRNVNDEVFNWILKCESPFGGFGILPGAESELKSTYKALYILSTTGRLDLINGEKHINWIKKIRKKTGCFSLHSNNNISFEHTFYAVASLNILRVKIPNAELCAEWMISHWREKQSKQDFRRTYYLADALNRMVYLEKAREDLIRWQAVHEIIIRNLRIDTNFDRIYFYIRILDILEIRDKSEAIQKIKATLEANSKTNAVLTT